MKGKLERFLLVLLWTVALLFSSHSRADAMADWSAALALMGDLRTPLSPDAMARGAVAIERALSRGGSTERECELIDAVAQFYHGGPERTHDMRLVYYERALSRARRHLPDDAEIAAMHTVASRTALARARERAEAAYANGRVSPRVRRIGYVSTTGGATFDAFREGMRTAGYIEGKDFTLEARFTEGRQDSFPDLIAELLAQGLDVLVAGSPPRAIAAIKADTTTPVVIAGVSDPAGLARGLARPHGHITGTTLATGALGGKWIEVMREVAPRATRLAVLINPEHPSREGWMRDTRAAATALGVEVAFREARDAATLATALAAIEGSDAQGLVVTGDPVFLVHRESIIASAARRGLPAVYFSKFFADAGGLVAYGGSLEDSYRKAARYVARILEGAKPAELPIEPAAIELVVNQKAARSIGIVPPASLVGRADKVID